MATKRKNPNRMCVSFECEIADICSAYDLETSWGRQWAEEIYDAINDAAFRLRGPITISYRREPKRSRR